MGHANFKMTVGRGKTKYLAFALAGACTGKGVAEVNTEWPGERERKQITIRESSALGTEWSLGRR